MKNGTGSDSADSTAKNEAKGEQPGTQTPTAQGTAGAASSNPITKVTAAPRSFADQVVDWFLDPL